MKQKRKIQKRVREYPKLSELRKLYKEGYPVKKAMELAGYSESTIQKKAWWYTKKLDFDELKKGLKFKNVLSAYRAHKVLDDLMENAEKERDRISAADSVLRSSKTFIGKEESPTTLVWAFQTFQNVGDTKIEVPSSEKPDEIIDVGKEPPKDD